MLQWLFPKKRAAAHFREGTAAARAGNLHEAVARLRRAVALQPDLAEVVAMQRHREHAQRRRESQRTMQALRHPRASGVDAHQRRFAVEGGPHALGQLAHELLGIRERRGHVPEDGRGSFGG